MDLLIRKERMRLVEWSAFPKRLIRKSEFWPASKGRLKPSPTRIPHCAPREIVAVNTSQGGVTEIETQFLILQELAVMSRINHPCCDYLIAWDWLPGRAATGTEPVIPSQAIVVTKYWEASLASVLAKSVRGQTPEGFTALKKSFIAFGIAFGMAYLHAENILHRNLKSANILLDANFFPRIAHFDVAEVLDLENPVGTPHEAGTPRYMAPEMDGDAAGAIFGAADVFAFGMILWELAEECQSFSQCTTPDDVRTAIHDGDMQGPPADASPEMADLIDRCWDPDPELRPRFADIVNTPEILMFPGTDEYQYIDFVSDLVQGRVIE
jgi:serine/threonine protein kinase